jgi:hypothetical protein
MKRCLKCGQAYTDESLNYCLNDGEILVSQTGYEQPPFADDTPPTILLDRTRVTNPVDWGGPLAPSAGMSPASNEQFAYPEDSKDQTLPTISMVLGILSILIVCCGGGIWLGLPAAIVGFIAMKNVDTNPMKYGGRGMATAGMVLGIVTFVASMVFLIFGWLS